MNEGTYVERLLSLLVGVGDREVLVHQQRRISGVQARSTVLRLANAMAGKGLVRGDGVGVLVGNSPEAVLLGLAVHLIGCRLVFVRTDRGKPEQVAFLDQAEVRALIFDSRFGNRAVELVRDSAIPVSLSLGPFDGYGTGGADLLALAATSPDTVPASTASAADVVTLLYTGGTTGRPKLVTQRHSYYQGLITVSAGQLLTDAEQPRLLVPASVTHTSGHLSAVAGLMTGGTVVVMDRFDAGEALSLIKREGVTSMMVMPPMLYELLDHPDCPSAGFPTLKRIYYTGAATAPARLRQAVERFGPVMHQLYGTTEGPGITSLPPEEHDLAKPHVLRSCGRPSPGVDVELRAADSTEVATGEVGELYARGPIVMSGYWGDPVRTSEYLVEGWLRTGDLAYRDDEGYIYLVDRVNDVIVTGQTSSNVYSRLLDDFLTKLPGIREAAAVGIPDERYGEAVHVFLVPDGSVALDLNEVRKLVVDELGALYEPNGFTLLAALPWTTVGKVDKKALRVSQINDACADRSSDGPNSGGMPGCPVQTN